MIVAGIDRVLGPQLYVLDPEGSMNAWNAICIGKQSDKVMESLVASFSEKSETVLSVAQVLPGFLKCLRKHFPEKTSTYVEKGEIGIANGVVSDEDVSSSVLPMTLVNDRNEGISSSSSSSSGSSSESEYNEDYWEFEITTIMLNSEGDVCISPLKSTNFTVKEKISTL